MSETLTRLTVLVVAVRIVFLALLEVVALTREYRTLLYDGAEYSCTLVNP